MSDDLVNRLEVRYEPDFLRVIRAAKAIRGSSRRTTMRAEKEVRGRMRLQPLVGNLLLEVARRQTAHQLLESMRAEDNPEHQKSTNLSAKPFQVPIMGCAIIAFHGGVMQCFFWLPIGTWNSTRAALTPPYQVPPTMYVHTYTQ